MKIGAPEMAKILNVNITTFYSLIQANVITQYERVEQKRQAYLFSVDDAAAAMAVLDLMSLGIGRRQAGEIGKTGRTTAKTGIEITIDIGKYKKMASKFYRNPK